MRRDHGVHVVADAASGYPAVEFLTVIGRQPLSCFESPRRTATWRCHRDPRGAAWETRRQAYDHDPDGSSHALRSVAAAQHDGQGRPAVRRPRDPSVKNRRLFRLPCRLRTYLTPSCLSPIPHLENSVRQVNLFRSCDRGDESVRTARALLFPRPCKRLSTKYLAGHCGQGRRHGSCHSDRPGEVP